MDFQGFDFSTLIDNQLKEKLIDRLKMRPCRINQIFFLFHPNSLSWQARLFQNWQWPKNALFNHIYHQVQVWNNNSAHTILISKIIIEFLKMSLAVCLFFNILRVIIKVKGSRTKLKFLEKLFSELIGIYTQTPEEYVYLRWLGQVDQHLGYFWGFLYWLLCHFLLLVLLYSFQKLRKYIINILINYVRYFHHTMSFSESKKFCRPPKHGEVVFRLDNKGIQLKLLQHVLDHVEQGNLDQAIDEIDRFCEKNWMMNLGPEKGSIVDQHMKGKQVNTVLEIGGYCGYSSLRFARAFPKAHIHTIEISEEFANIARQIQKHAGVSERITIHVSIVQNSEEPIKAHGPYDMIFIDHFKDVYLKDFLLLEKYGVIKKGTVIVGDNIIFPGAPDYLQWFKECERYDKLLQHAYVEYSDTPDAVLFSEKIVE